jgi:CSLREA domain-containing protein
MQHSSDAATLHQARRRICVPGRGWRKALAHLARAFPLLVLPLSLQGATHTVNSLGDEPDSNQADGVCATSAGVCTLRAAILQANAFGGADVINFAISGVIAPSTDLPDVKEAVTIDATTAPGYTSVPVVILSGEPNHTKLNGLTLTADSHGSTVRGLAIRGFGQNGIASYGNGNTFTRNHLGVTVIGGGGNRRSGLLVQANDNVIGGTSYGDRNVVSGNGTGSFDSGILIVGTGNVVQYSFIGTNDAGTATISNNGTGVVLDGEGNTVRHCLVSGNRRSGIELKGRGHTVILNVIGLDLAETAALPNVGGGVFVSGSQHNIGGPGVGNVISGNGLGIFVSGPFSGEASNVIAGNVIGGSFPNGGWGVDIQFSNGNTIGGDEPAAANLISGNTGGGVFVRSGTRNRVRLNSIHSNRGLAINLFRDANTGDGVSYNDPGDLDAGANDVQNFPVLTAATEDSVSGVLRSAPNRTYLVDVFSSSACDPTGFGQAARLEATTVVTTGANGADSFQVSFPAVEPGTVFSAMATDPVGNSSELSQCIAVDRLPVETLTLVNPDPGWASLIGSQVDHPPLNAYDTFVVGQPAGGQYVMGDWDADGLATLAVYASNGVFYYTNEVGRASTWTALWFGFLGYPPVAGRFDAAVPHDCLGVVHGAPDPPRGDQFAVYFTCDLTSGPDPPKQFQYLGPPLPDDAGFSGQYQFTAGDFDGDGIDSFAARRGPYVSWTNVPPTTMLAAFDHAQFQGLPNAGYGRVVAADWDGDGISSFGLFYPDNTVFRRNDLAWNSGAYELQHVGEPIGSPVTPLTWRPGGNAGVY